MIRHRYMANIYDWDEPELVLGSQGLIDLYVRRLSRKGEPKERFHLTVLSPLQLRILLVAHESLQITQGQFLRGRDSFFGV